MARSSGTTVASEETFEGQTIYVQYEGGSRVEQNLWHARVLLRRAGTTSAKDAEEMHEQSVSVDNCWWTLTPDGDVYVDCVDCPPLRSVAFLDEKGNSSEEDDGGEQDLGHGLRLHRGPRRGVA